MYVIISSPLDRYTALHGDQGPARAYTRTQAPDSNSIRGTPRWNHTCQQRRILSDRSVSNPDTEFEDEDCLLKET